MNYWMTTHWPPREDDPDNVASGVWVPDGREIAGSDLETGDFVLIYQARSGRTELRRAPDGTVDRVRCLKGAGCIIAIAKVKERLFEDPESRPTDYTDGTRIWWRWFAPIDVLSRSGFVPRAELNNVLGYAQSYSFRGFGHYHSGLKKISAEQYYALTDLFRNNLPNTLPCEENQDHGTRPESEEHRLLKKYVAWEPSQVLGERGLTAVATEYTFPTGDRADVVLEDHTGRIIGVEIEVSVGDNQLAGVLQSIKYRYMLEPLTQRVPGDSRAFLVAYFVSPSVNQLCERYDVECFVVNKADVSMWVGRSPSRSSA